MFAALALVLAVVWVLALITMKTAGLAIHLLLVLAVISFIAHMMKAAVPGPMDRTMPPV